VNDDGDDQASEETIGDDVEEGFFEEFVGSLISVC
jgi:hypothetical protein